MTITNMYNYVQICTNMYKYFTVLYCHWSNVIPRNSWCSHVSHIKCNPNLTNMKEGQVMLSHFHRLHRLHRLHWLHHFHGLLQILHDQLGGILANHLCSFHWHLQLCLWTLHRFWLLGSTDSFFITWASLVHVAFWQNPHPSCHPCSHSWNSRLGPHLDEKWLCAACHMCRQYTAVEIRSNIM